MDGARFTWIAIAVALAALGGWILYATLADSRGGILPAIVGPSYEWDVTGESPWVVGGPQDRFAYAGGVDIAFASGTARVRTTSGGQGRIEIRVDVIDAPAFVGTEAATVRIELTAAVVSDDTLFQDLLVNGNTGRGDPRLPATHADLAGTAEFSVTVDGLGRFEPRLGWWSVGDAVRRADGSIRQEGLLFSPLLRDKTGFSDPTRKELTILLYAPSASDGDRPVDLHLVFCSVRLDSAPEGVSRP